jgi:hypothetical protein
VTVTVLRPFNLDVFAYICRIVAIIYCGLKGKITKVCSYGDLSPSALGLLPYKLVPITILLAKIARIHGISVTYDRALKPYSMSGNLLRPIEYDFS